MTGNWRGDGKFCKRILSDPVFREWFEREYMRMYPLLYRFFMSRRDHNSKEAEDLTDETMISFLESLEKGKANLGSYKREDIEPFIWKIAKNKLYDYLTKHYYGRKEHKKRNEKVQPTNNQEFNLRPHNRVPIPLEDYLSLTDCSQNEPLRNIMKDPQEVMEEKEEIAAIDIALGLLNPRDREILDLHYFRDYSWKAVGRMTGLSENAARLRGHRAKEKFEKLLKPWFGAA